MRSGLPHTFFTDLLTSVRLSSGMLGSMLLCCSADWCCNRQELDVKKSNMAAAVTHELRRDATRVVRLQQYTWPYLG